MIGGCAGDPPIRDVELVACEPVHVNVPVAVRVRAPDSLLAPLAAGLPIFIEPGPDATSCLTPAGEQAMIDFVDECAGRLDAWRAWDQE